MTARRLPVVAIVGRPNVGKSTLVNRLVGQRIAVVEDVPGVTRDRVAHPASWGGRDFTVVDTGGWEPRAKGLAGAVAEQAEVAVAEADAVLLVVDTTVGATAEDRAAAAVVQRSGRPALLIANKADDANAELEAAALWSLGLGEPVPVSALHGRGSGDLLDMVVALLPDAPAALVEEPVGPRRVALVGRPNVGKSSLLNKLLGQQRVLVDAEAGTTRDPVDAEVEIAGSTYLFVDTAGLRRRTKEAAGAEYYASLRTHTALERAEVAVLVLDASQPLTEQDQRIATMIIEAGRALVLVLNKWDLVDEDRRYELERELPGELGQIGWAPRVNVSAKTGRALDKLPRAIEAALEGWDTRVPTGRLNAWLGEVIAATPPPARGGRAPRVRFATQADVRPPRFVLFSSGFLEETYRRFLTRRLREDFGFVGTPIELSVRLRERKDR
ncbi:MAG TPA: ribosome biogenesis GTPase Der [Mycobacteriales bacterium]|nr:ribosome biogenesis GTPase Der [Mycobacteriales bacterium]